jgi:hypothetical protein
MINPTKAAGMIETPMAQRRMSNKHPIKNGKQFGSSAQKTNAPAIKMRIISTVSKA